MMYSFTRNHEVNGPTMSEINRELKNTMEATVRGEYTEEELADYCRHAIRDGEPLPKDPNMVFWGYDAPQSMPADCRCVYFYLPTYLIVLTMIAGINRYPRLMEIDGMQDTLSRGLFACTGRGLQGSGYESYRILLENLTMFINAGILTFLRDYPGIGNTFGEIFNKRIEQIRSDYNNGQHIADWNTDFSKEQKALLELYENKQEEA